MKTKTNPKKKKPKLPCLIALGMEDAFARLLNLIRGPGQRLIEYIKRKG